MTIFVDPLAPGYVRGLKAVEFCHCWTDGDDAELDALALRIGLKREWAQLSQGALVGRFYHYDLTPNKRALALKAGAVVLPMQDWIVRRMNERGITL